jgi:hypothetical protein
LFQQNSKTMTTVTIEYKSRNYSTKFNTTTVNEPVMTVTFESGYKETFSCFVGWIANAKLIDWTEEKKVRGRISVPMAQKFVSKWEAEYKKLNTFAA